MSTTPEVSQQDQAEFDAAFNGAEPVHATQTEDEAFGLTPEAEEADGGADEPTESTQEAEAEAGVEGQAGDDAHGAAPAIVIAVEPGEATDDEQKTPEDIQREKSWEGRLKAREAELKAREDALKQNSVKPEEAAEESAEGESPEQEAAEPEVTEALESAVEQVQSGQLTAAEALQALANDFGEDFTKALSALIKAEASEIAGKTADEKVGQVSQKLDGISGEIMSDKQRAHFEAISDAHPDFIEVAESPEFKAHIDAMDETQKDAAMKTIESGSARAIVKLLTSFKDSKKADPVPEPAAKAGPDEATQKAMDAAEGVRGRGGLKLPEKPAASQDYEDAWREF